MDRPAPPAADVAIVDLTAAPEQPLDRGASSLGLIMLVLAASIGAATLAVTVGVGLARDLGWARPWGQLAVALSVARLAIHARAGWLLHDHRPGARRWIHWYAAIAVAQALPIWFVARAADHLGDTAWMAAAALLAWPAAVLVAVHTRRLDGACRGDAVGGERATAAALFAIGGALVAIPAVAVALVGLVGGDGRLLIGAVALAVPGAIGARALVVARRGLAGEVSMASAAEGVAFAATVFGGLVSLFLVVTIVGVIALPLWAGCWIGLPWLLIRHARAEIPAREPIRERAGAALALGWLLLAQGLVLLTHAEMVGVGADAAGDGSPVMLLAGGWVLGPPVVHVALGAVEVWAAIELIRGTARARVATALFALGAVVAAGTQWLDDLRRVTGQLRDLDAPSFDHGSAVMATIYTGWLLVIPVVTAWVVLGGRRGAATAVVRTRPAPE